MSTVLDIDRISLSLGGRRVLSDVSLSLRHGEIVALVGPSGSGKTSLLRIILGLVAPSEGTVRIGGRAASVEGRIVLPPDERDLGAVFQDLALWPHLSVRGHLEFGLSAKGIQKAERTRRIDAILEQVGLSELGHRKPRELSGGQRQRVAIARAIATQPSCVVLDEPFTNLDIVLKDEILALLASLLHERAAAAILVAHEPREAMRLAERIAVLEQGELVQVGTRRELVDSPVSPFVRAFIRGKAAR